MSSDAGPERSKLVTGREGLRRKKIRNGQGAKEVKEVEPAGGGGRGGGPGFLTLCGRGQIGRYAARHLITARGCAQDKKKKEKRKCYSA